MATLKFLWTDDEGCEIEEQLAAKWEICDTCEGEGKHCQHLGAITQSEFSQWDQEEINSYFSGGYDKQCDDCKGLGKVLAYDWDAIDPEIVKKIEEQQEEDRRYQRERESERRMGC